MLAGGQGYRYQFGNLAPLPIRKTRVHSPRSVYIRAPARLSELGQTATQLRHIEDLIGFDRKLNFRESCPTCVDPWVSGKISSRESRGQHMGASKCRSWMVGPVVWNKWVSGCQGRLFWWVWGPKWDGTCGLFLRCGSEFGWV